MKEELTHAASLQFEKMVHQIKERLRDMEKLKNKWHLDTKDREAGDKGYWEKWEKVLGPTYRDMADRFLIFSHVCEELWDGKEECKHDDTWEDKYDQRGESFRVEYVKEVHDMITEILPVIKEQRKQKGDL